MESIDIDSADGLPLGSVGPWATRKHEIVGHYVRITKGVRAKFEHNAVFVDLYCGPGRARIKDTTDCIQGSSMAAWMASTDSKFYAPFRRVIVADKNADFVSACCSRLGDAPVEGFVGDAAECTRQIIEVLDRTAYTLVLVDPFNLEGLKYEIFDRFAALDHVDFIVHFSTMDIQRNVDRYMASANSPLDEVVPGWRGQIEKAATNEEKLRRIFDQWKRVIGDREFKVEADPEAITNSKNRWIYWLACASRHPLAANFWTKIRALGPQPDLFS